MFQQVVHMGVIGSKIIALVPVLGGDKMGVVQLAQDQGGVALR
jgi:hypothetical protein